jgi:hypothetical protein
VIEGLDPDQQETVDAFLKRFEQLADLMAKLGAILSAEEWSRVAVLRNRLAHGYPSDAVRQASRVQETVGLAPVALAALDVLERYLAAKPELTASRPPT